MPSQAPGFRALFDAHATFVWRVLKRHGVSERELDDGCQEVFLVVHRRLPEFEGRAHIRTWIYAIAQRVAHGMRRKAHVKRERFEEAPVSEQVAATQHDAASARESLALIELALSGLSDDKREVFALYDLEGMTMAEVAQAVGVAENTALSRLYAAREEIQSFVRRRTQGPQRAPQHSTLARQGS